MEATITIRDSFIGLWFEETMSKINAQMGYFPAAFFIVGAETRNSSNNNNSDSFNEDDITVEQITPEEAEKFREAVNAAISDPPSDKVWSESKMQFEQTVAEDDWGFTSDPISGAVPYQGNAMGTNFEMNDDQLDNFVDDAIEALRPKDEQEAKLYKYTVLAVLGMTLKARTTDVVKRCNNDEENLIFINSLFRFFNNMSWFTTTTALDISEFMTKEQILNVMRYLNEQSMFDVDYAFAGMLRKAQEAFSNEERRRMSNNGQKEVSGDDIITPIIFNNTFLGSMDLVSGNVPAPMIQPSLVKTIVSKVSKLAGIDIKNKKEGPFVHVEGFKDPDNPTSCADLGAALVQIKDRQTGFVHKQFLVDLDTITGTGLNIIAKAIYQNQIVTTFINLDKDVEIARKFILNQGEYIINTNTPEGLKEYEQLSKKLLPDPRVYIFYDLSGMHKELEGLTPKQAKRISNRLMQIVNLPWQNLGDLTAPPFRFRFRDFKAYNDFTLVSDKDVRVQDRTWMAKPYGNPYGKLYMDRPGLNTDKKLIVKVKGEHFSVTLDGVEIDWQK